MRSIGRFGFIVLLIAACWWGMQVVHEFGHVTHAWVSDGRVERVVLHPLEISRTDVSPNPRPRFVAWGGPIWGSVLPLVAWLVARQFGWQHAWLLRFFAGFCLVANGGYLLGGALYPVGDAEVLLRHGAWRGTLIVFGVMAIAGGLCLWNGQSRHFRGRCGDRAFAAQRQQA